MDRRKLLLCVGTSLVQGSESLAHDQEPTPSGLMPPAYFTTTAYCLQGRTASGSFVGHGTVAAPPSFAFGTRLFIEGYGEAVVADRGPLITEGRLDLWMSSCSQAIQWGRRSVKVWRL